MAVLNTLQPTSFFHYFEEITQIPHGSGDIDRISDYLVEFAQKHHLFYLQDEMKNVIIKKPASPGYENAPVVILQGHMDMVCAATADSLHDFKKDPLKLYIDGDWVRAKNTTLGGDDGAAIAYALAILESDTILHPALEVVITVDEEIGLLGASGLDMSALNGRIMINLDSEEEDCLIAGCAGGVRSESRIPIQYTEMEGYGCRLVLDGLKGGHSGGDIDKMHGNAALLMGRFLYELRNQMEYGLCEWNSGAQDNAIPCRAEAYILIDEGNRDLLLQTVQSYEETLRRIYRETDGDMHLCVEFEGHQIQPALHPASFTKVLFLMMQIPSGIQKMSGDIIGMPETSLNPGIVSLQPEVFSVHCCIRSSFETEKRAVADKIAFLTEFLGGECILSGDYPGWEFVKDSQLREVCVKAYETLLGKTMRVDLIHAGLECGIFAAALPGLDCVSFGPDMQDIHTVNERLSISSVQRVWDLLQEVLKNIH